MQQRKKKKSLKAKSAALLMEFEKKQQEELTKARIKDSRKKGNTIIESESTDTDSDSDDEIDLIQMMAMFAKNFKRMKFNKRTGKLSKRPTFKKGDEKAEKSKSLTRQKSSALTVEYWCILLVSVERLQIKARVRHSSQKESTRQTQA